VINKEKELMYPSKIIYLFCFSILFLSCVKTVKRTYLINESKGLRIRELKKIDGWIYRFRKRALFCKQKQVCEKYKKEWIHYSEKTAKYLEKSLQLHPSWSYFFIKDILKQLKRPLYIMRME